MPGRACNTHNAEFATAIRVQGKNGYGQLGTGGNAAGGTPVATPASSADFISADAVLPSLRKYNWATVSCGHEITCATKADGSAWCWGRANTYGTNGLTDVTGLPAQFDAQVPELLQKLTGVPVSAIRVGVQAACALQDFGEPFVSFATMSSIPGSKDANVSITPPYLGPAPTSYIVTLLSLDGTHNFTANCTTPAECIVPADFGTYKVRTTRDRPRHAHNRKCIV